MVDAVTDRGRSTLEPSGMRVVSAGHPEATILRIVVVGPEKATRLVAHAVKDPEAARIVELNSIAEAEDWLTGCHVDLLVVDASLVEGVQTDTLRTFRCSPLGAFTAVCVVGQGAGFTDPELLRSLRAWYCSFEDEATFASVLECGTCARASAGGGFVLSGALPGGGIRFILPILEAERRSGRLVLEPLGDETEQLTVWIRDGEPIAAYADGVRLDDPIGRAHAVSGGWFSFVETTVDRDVLRPLDARSDHVGRAGLPPSAPRSAIELRERLRVVLATARTVGEMRDAIQSLLDLGIDKAAEDGDTSLMDSLADLSILLQKNKIDEAFRLLKMVLK